LHLTLALEAGYQTGEKPVTAALVETGLSRQLDDLEPTLTRHGYRLKDMVEQFDAKPAEIRALFNNKTRTGAHCRAARPDACRWPAHLILPMKFKQFTVANCFSSFMLPHVLFVEEFETRKKATMSCCFAWNISLFPEAEQEDHIERIWELVEADNRDAPPLGLEQGFKQDLRMLVARKQELFPWTHTNIPKADLIGIGRRDVLKIATGTSSAEEVEILAWPSPTGLPRCQGDNIHVRGY
jgi:hypothetical protein